MSHRPVTPGACARTTPRHLLRGAVRASSYGRTGRARATTQSNANYMLCAALSNRFGAAQGESSIRLCGRSLLRTRDLSARQLLTDQDNVARQRPTDIRLITVDNISKLVAQLSATTGEKENSM